MLDKIFVSNNIAKILTALKVFIELGSLIGDTRATLDGCQNDGF